MKNLSHLWKKPLLSDNTIKTNEQTNTPAKCLPPQLRLEKVSVLYDKKIAVENASLIIPAGKITALVGPSGCGKSSLLSTINRMTDNIQGCQVNGNIYLDDECISDKKINLSALRRRIGIVSQQPNPFPMSIQENFLFPLKEHGIRDTKTACHKMEQSLKQVGLWAEIKDRLKSQALDLSGGQQQRLCIARCLVLNPSVLLFDEPCSALDPVSSKTVEDLIKSLKTRYTILMVTHNLSQARRIADYTAVCWVQAGNGCIIESGETSTIFEKPVHPITQAFCSGMQG